MWVRRNKLLFFFSLLCIKKKFFPHDMNNILLYEEETTFLFSNYVGQSLTWHVNRSVPASIEEGSCAGGGRIFFHRLGSLRQFGNQSNQSREHPAPRGEKQMRIDFRILHRKSQLGEARAHQSARLLLDFRFFEYILYVPRFLLFTLHR